MRVPGIPMILGASALLALAASTATAQQKSTLARPDAETKESFTRIGAIRELASGKVLVADPSDKIVQLVDLAGGSMAKVGREGNGPGEYALPFALIPLPDGTTLIQDVLNQRFLIVGTDGKPGAFITMPAPRPPSGGAGGPVIFGGITRINGWDNQGRLYFPGSPFSADGGSADSVPVLRWDRVKPTFDTLGYIKQPPNSAQRSGGGGTVSIRIGNNKVWVPTETWGVAGDGRIARLIPEPYRLVWMTGRGAPVMGPVIPYTPIKVTQADKDEFAEQTRRNPGTRISIGAVGGGGGPRVSTGGGSGGGNFQPPPPEFNDTKPPFAGGGAGGGGPVVAPDGEVWVLRTRAAGDKIPTYDVFDKTGALVKKISLNPNSRVVGFGNGTVYVARSDDDDLQYLQRYKRP